MKKYIQKSIIRSTSEVSFSLIFAGRGTQEWRLTDWIPFYLSLSSNTDEASWCPDRLRASKLRLNPNEMETLIVGAASWAAELCLDCSGRVCTYPKFGDAPKSVTRDPGGLAGNRWLIRFSWFTNCNFPRQKHSCNCYSRSGNFSFGLLQCILQGLPNWKLQLIQNSD